jgi:release factor glutamine methyltransferase
MRRSVFRWWAWRIPTTDLGGWLAHAYTLLAPVSENPVLEVQLLAGHVLEQPRTWVISHPNLELEDEQAAELEKLLERLLKREPLPYLLEKAEFYGLTFTVSPSVLIPRPETELLVETAAGWLQAHPERRQVVDVGTGSGAIAVTLAVLCPEIHVLAVDRSWEALKIARQNIERYGVSRRVIPVMGDLLQPLSGPFDLVCANLPYIPSEKLADLDVSRYEPRMALDGGPDGLDFIERLLADLPKKLAAGGMALLEIEADQGLSSLRMAREYIPTAQSKVVRDLAEKARLVVVGGK